MFISMSPAELNGRDSLRQPELPLLTALRPSSKCPSTAFQQPTSVAAFQEKVSAGFWGGVVPGNLGQLKPLLHAGCFGFKCFLTPSGVDEFPCIDEADLRLALIELGSLGALLLVHAELSEFISSPTSDVRSYSNYLNSRPKIAENSAIQLLLRLSAETGCAVHVVHLSSAEALEFLRAARSRRLPVTVETCPHYLAFRAEEIPDGATEFKCAPPIREANNCEALWEGLRDGDIDMIVTDHSPCPPQMKQKSTGDFFAAWGAIGSLQLSLPVVWTEANRRGFKEEDIARWMAAAPARLAGLSNKKGKIAPGYDADFVVWDPAEEFTVKPENLCHRHKLTPYASRRRCGVVKETYLRGQPISSACQPVGRILRHSHR
jgi:allantoinase